jgi:serine/threonine protein kinase
MMLSLDPSDPSCSKIADFGTSCLCTLPLSGRLVDNPVWLAPEILANSEFTFTVDTYAYGVMLWEMITREDYLGDSAFMSEIEDKVSRRGRRGGKVGSI